MLYRNLNVWNWSMKTLKIYPTIFSCRCYKQHYYISVYPNEHTHTPWWNLQAPCDRAGWPSAWSYRRSSSVSWVAPCRRSPGSLVPSWWRTASAQPLNREWRSWHAPVGENRAVTIEPWSQQEMAGSHWWFITHTHTCTHARCTPSFLYIVTNILVTIHTHTHTYSALGGSVVMYVLRIKMHFSQNVPNSGVPTSLLHVLVHPDWIMGDFIAMGVNGIIWTGWGV